MSTTKTSSIKPKFVPRHVKRAPVVRRVVKPSSVAPVSVEKKEETKVTVETKIVNKPEPVLSLSAIASTNGAIDTIKNTPDEVKKEENASTNGVIDTIKNTPDEVKKEENASNDDNKLPAWARKPIPTLVLVEMKNGIVLGKIKLGDKQRYIFGREQEGVDVLLHHQSISRKHCAIVHGTPPGTKAEHTNSATLVDLNAANGTFYKKNITSEKKFRLAAGTGVVLREGMIISFGSSSRSYQVVGISKISNIVAGSVHEYKANVALSKKKQEELVGLNKHGKAFTMKRKGERTFSNQASVSNAFEQRKRSKISQGRQLVDALEKKANIL